MNIEDPRRIPRNPLEEELWDVEVDRNRWKIRYQLLRGDVGWLCSACFLGGLVLGIILTRAVWGLL